MIQESAPDRGDFFWIAFDPPAGREQAGRRPALILSPLKYNRVTGLAIACPVTSRVKGYPFEIALPGGLGLEGVVLADQIKTLDWRRRGGGRICRAPASFVAEVFDRLAPLLGYEQ